MVKNKYQSYCCPCRSSGSLVLPPCPEKDHRIACGGIASRKERKKKKYIYIYFYFWQPQTFILERQVLIVTPANMMPSSSSGSRSRSSRLLLIVVIVALVSIAHGWRGTSMQHRTIVGSSRRSYPLFMSDSGESTDQTLLEQMRKALGEKDDVFSEAEKESKQLMQGLRDLDRDPNMKANNKFLEWLASNGVWVKMESSWGRAPHPLVIASNTEDDGESCGRGLLARDGMTEGELMMTIPLDLCLTRAVSQETFGKSVVPDYLDEYIAIALLLMHEKLKGTMISLETAWPLTSFETNHTSSIYDSYVISLSLYALAVVLLMSLHSQFSLYPLMTHTTILPPIDNDTLLSYFVTYIFSLLSSPSFIFYMYSLFVCLSLTYH